MKKITKIFSVLIFALFTFNFLAPPVPAHATDVEDASCDDAQITNLTHQDYVIVTKTFQQTFTPTRDILDGIDILVVAMPLDVGSNVTAEIRRSSDNALLSSQNGTILNDGPRWIGFYYPQLPLVPGQEYKILLRTLAPGAYWPYSSGANCYAGGYAIANGAIQADKDFGFFTYAHNSATPTPTPRLGNSATATNSKTPTPTTAKSTGTTTATTLISRPFITEVKKNNQKIDLTKNATIDLSDADRLTVSGTTMVGSTVALVIGSDNFETFVNEKGVWTTTLDVGVIKRGEFMVQAKALKDGQASELTNVVKIKVSDTIQAKANQNKFQWSIYYTLGLIGLVILGIVAAVLIIKKRRATAASK